MINGQGSQAVLDRVGLDADTVEDMYQTMAIANYEDRFVIPTSYRAAVERNFSSTGDCGFSFGNGCSSGYSVRSSARTSSRRSMSSICS